MIAPEPYLRACLAVLYQATIDARLLGRSDLATGSQDERDRLYDLMDAVHNIPYLITRWETVNEKLLRDMLLYYDKKWSAYSHSCLLPVYDGTLRASQPAVGD